MELWDKEFIDLEVPGHLTYLLGDQTMKTMKALVAAAGVSLAVLAPSAQAQFDGPYVGAGIGMYKGTVTIEEEVGNFESAGTGKHKEAFNLNGGYGHSFGNFHIAGELSYHNEFGRTAGSGADEELGHLTLKLQNVIALSVLPGFKLNSNSLPYVRLGYVQAKLKGPQDINKSFNGILWGIGVKLALSRNLVGTIEYQVLDLKRKNVLDMPTQPMGTGLLIGVQYNFW